MLKSLQFRSVQFSGRRSAAVWAKAIHNSDISMLLASWYRYTKDLGITKARTPKKVLKTRKSVRASSVNEIWHMDVSHFMTEDNIKFYIYTVVDNFSQRIVTYDVSTVLSAQRRLNSLKWTTLLGLTPCDYPFRILETKP